MSEAETTEQVELESEEVESRERIPKELTKSADPFFDDSKSIYIGNLDGKIRAEDVVKIFEDIGKKVTKIELKNGFAFVYVESGAEEAIAQLNGTTYMDRKLRLELARGDGRIKHRREDERRKASQATPTRTLFVVNFDPYETREGDLRNAFESYGTVVRVDIRKNYAFVEFETVEAASEAMKNMDGSKILDREIIVEFCAGGARDSRRDRRDMPGRSRSRSRSPPRGGRPMYGRSRMGYPVPPPTYYQDRYDDRFRGPYAYDARYGAGGYERYYERDYGHAHAPPPRFDPRYDERGYYADPHREYHRDDRP